MNPLDIGAAVEPEIEVGSVWLTASSRIEHNVIALTDSHVVVLEVGNTEATPLVCTIKGFRSVFQPRASLQYFWLSFDGEYASILEYDSLEGARNSIAGFIGNFIVTYNPVTNAAAIEPA